MTRLEARGWVTDMGSLSFTLAPSVNYGFSISTKPSLTVPDINLRLNVVLLAWNVVYPFPALVRNVSFDVATGLLVCAA